MANINVTPEEVGILGRTCEQRTVDIENLITAITNQIANTTWESPAARKFREDWGTHRDNLKRLEDELRALGRAASTMATNYTDADAAYGKG
jgi:uncharacterized protein YukE